ncbi:uncharacterized protein LOC134745939 [Cydia strobilella]|uniref:uncharacterized protein LOC134745939 n=1 Tax=Cydia strobilella TaxID=1100964 RepID=UPI003005D9F4
MEVLKDYDNADTISIDTLALEELLEEERARELADLNSLSKKVCHLHTSLLYYRNSKSKMGAASYETWRTLVKKVGGTPDGWRDLGYILGIPQDDLDYISNSMKYEPDPTNVVLKVFMQDEDSTLDKIIDAFLKLKRYDILKALEQSLLDLTQCFNDKQEDSGYHSNSKNVHREIISYMKNLVNDLPPALSRNKDYNQPNPVPRIPLNPVDINVQKDGPVLFLTYAEDGLRTACNIQQLVAGWDSEVTVVMLNDRRDEVYQNPERFIREYVEKADYVVPILTTGYLSAIRTHNTSAPSTNGNLDHKYVNYVYNLITGQYIYADGCLNKKVRSVLPEGVFVPWMLISSYPVLKPWTCEADFDKQFKSFLGLTGS